MLRKGFAPMKSLVDKRKIKYSLVIVFLALGAWKFSELAFAAAKWSRHYYLRHEVGVLQVTAITLLAIIVYLFTRARIASKLKLGSKPASPIA